MSRVLEIANPFHRRWFYALPHAAVIALIALSYVLVFGLGWTTAKYGSAFYRNHYSAPIPVPHAGKPVRIRTLALPVSGSINLSRYPGIADQKQMGSCAAFATAWDLTYEWRVLHPTSWLRFSPRWLYDYFSDTYNAGQDGGSWPDQNLEIVQSSGALRYKMLPYPPYQIDNPMPAVDAFGNSSLTDAAQHRLPVHIHNLGADGTGGGSGLVTAIKQAINQNHGVLMASGVYPPFDAATQTGGLIDLQQPGDGSRGGHEFVGIAYNDSLRFPSGAVGGIAIQNQWGPYWGNHGRAWLSYRMVAQDVFGAKYLTIGTATSGTKPPPPAVVDPHAPVHRAPPVPPRASRHLTAPKPRSAGWYVHNVRLTTGQDIAPLLNYWGNRYRVWPVGLAATVGVESGMNPNAERWAGGLDNSCGLLQQIITNVAYYTGIQGARAECNWEEVPGNSVYLGARIYAEYFSYQHNCVQWPQAYGMYNAGAGYSCSYYYNPAGDVAAHLQVFYGWYNYALSHWAGGFPPPPPPPPTPKPRQTFPHSKWCHWTTRHHRACPSPRWHGHLGTVAREWAFNKKAFGKDGHPRSVCRGILKGEEWNAQRRVMKTSFAGCTVWSWPQFRHDPTLWYRGRH